MSPLAEDKQEMLNESHKFIKHMWIYMIDSIGNFFLSIKMLGQSYSLIITQWMTGDD